MKPLIYSKPKLEKLGKLREVTRAPSVPRSLIETQAIHCDPVCFGHDGLAVCSTR